MWSRSLARQANRWSGEALGAVADHEQAQIVVQDAQEVGGPDQILHALGGRESADDADEPGVGRALQFLRGVRPGRRRWARRLDAVGDHRRIARRAVRASSH